MEASAMSGTRRKPGQLGPYVETDRAWLGQRGYTPQTVRNMLKDLGQIGWWKTSEGLREAGRDEDVMAAFLVASRASGHRSVLWPRGLAPRLSYLTKPGG